jgi:hypothetical protein
MEDVSAAALPDLAAFLPLWVKRLERHGPREGMTGRISAANAGTCTVPETVPGARNPVPGNRATKCFGFCDLTMSTVFQSRCRRFLLFGGANAGASVISQILSRRILAVPAVRWPRG